MSEPEKLDQESKGTREEKTTESAKPRRAFLKVRRELSEEELSSPAAHRLLLDELDRSEQQVIELSGFRERFHKIDKEKAVLDEKMHKSLASEIIFALCLTIGAALMGLSPFFWNMKTEVGLASFVIGIILIIGGIVLRAVLK